MVAARTSQQTRANPQIAIFQRMAHQLVSDVAARHNRADDVVSSRKALFHDGGSVTYWARIPPAHLRQLLRCVFDHRHRGLIRQQLDVLHLRRNRARHIDDHLAGLFPAQVRKSASISAVVRKYSGGWLSASWNFWSCISMRRVLSCGSRNARHRYHRSPISSPSFTMRRVMSRTPSIDLTALAHHEGVAHPVTPDSRKIRDVRSCQRSKPQYRLYDCPVRRRCHNQPSRCRIAAIWVRGLR